MKKKIGFIIGGIVTIFIIGGMIIFALSGNKENVSSNLNIAGTWEVAAVVENNKTTLVDDEYMVFTDSVASDYRDGKSEPYVTSNYKIKQGEQTKIVLSDISLEYIVENKCDDHICLYENKDKYSVLIRYPNDDMSSIESDDFNINGKWNVVYRNVSDDVLMNEILEFSDSQLKDYRNGSSEPTAVSSFEWINNNCLFADTWNKQFELHKFSENKIFFIEVDTGYVWVLQKM